MKTAIRGAVLALGLAGATLSMAGAASAAEVGISLNLGNVAFAYQDGYWDHAHHWHRWRNSHEARDYRAKQGPSYHNWNHNRDRDHGWHDHN
ncbi:MAG: hypothetical protein P4L72_06070 [Parvibaculum sp.]|jgi:hypothetical protein|uniref:hypothetical protein n=1 Tax=Parvibaculum sp. TaxID=2024848 RepID=UPI000DCD0B36|nr:hypothetical protein [Parvibaculum sp.]MDR3498775.1 hypothetical protein [Parvibaculum sp.]RAV91170.1 hypothetical protein DBT45_09295 [Aerococcus tenax]RAV91734.1 hypothetical protein DBT53_11135 [Aerococcus mictus]